MPTCPFRLGALIVVGASAACTAAVPDTGALEQAGSIVLSDLGSRTGVFVRIKGEQELIPGDEIIVGRTRMQLEALSA